MDKNTQPLVSVVIPVYNGGEYFETCLESILHQTYKNWECIINNNCSKDDTEKVANEFVKKDNRFKLFNNEDFLNMTDNWNMACSRRSKESRYLKVLGADDWLFPESLEKMVAVMEEHPTAGLCSSYRLNDRFVDMDGLDIWEGNLYKGKDILYRQLTRTLDISGSNSTILFAVEHLKKPARYPKVFDDTTYHEDTELVYEMMNMADVCFVFQVLSYTRRHAKAYTTTEVFRYNTLLQLNEKVLWEYKGQDKTLNKLYRVSRFDYAYFMFLKFITFDRESIHWHKKYIVRKFKFHEYLLGILFRNKVSQFMARQLRKIFS